MQLNGELRRSNSGDDPMTLDPVETLDPMMEAAGEETKQRWRKFLDNRGWMGPLLFRQEDFTNNKTPTLEQ
jgi:hypothetical protein